MPVYSYKAKKLNGKTVSGRLNASDKTQLASRLMADGLYLLAGSEAAPAVTFKKMKPKKLSDFNLQIGTMLTSGITLTSAIEIMLQRDLSKEDRRIYEALYDKLLAGEALSEAAQELGEVFPPLLINMYISGEANGTLDSTCMKMSEHYTKEDKLRSKIKSAMTYPVILLVLLIIVMAAIFNLILPRFLSIYGDMELPALTQGIIAFSKLFTDYWLYTLIGVCVLVLFITLIRTVPAVRVELDRWKLVMPVIGKLMRTIYTARFARTLSSLYSTGITILNSLEIARGTVGNAYIAQQFDGVIGDVRNGKTLSEAIKKIDGYDPKLASTIMIGEETGKLDGMLTNVADSFDYEADMATARLTTIIEPVMICIMAVAIALVMVGVMLPIMNLYSSISSAAQY